ncbi:MAG: tRNA (adenosine(37)-N6)-threonylcarbamoyltransferase complex ATPase subunit type 1 TsaE [Opitutaceae bacterium]|jgi:tRNA threonylcarbamoyladenosine biosynthesis protein TsaE|nr:tRNA (adenosine(37)-N6)-threonylcarbamoyltransferase complex ATPase subunit type 1 TsaE [Opitutaceae bacterium]
MDSSIFAELRAGVATASAEDTRALAARLAAAVPAGTVLALHGDLGAGKTTFTQGFARGLGIQESITSPTFNIFTLHRGPGPDGAIRTLVHLDAYRLDGGAQLEDLMIDDFLTPPWWLVVEWPSKVADWLPPGALHLELGHLPDRRHHLRLRA